jgi:hypothetical protein
MLSMMLPLDRSPRLIDSTGGSKEGRKQERKDHRINRGRPRGTRTSRLPARGESRRAIYALSMSRERIPKGSGQAGKDCVSLAASSHDDCTQKDFAARHVTPIARTPHGCKSRFARRMRLLTAAVPCASTFARGTALPMRHG